MRRIRQAEVLQVRVPRTRARPPAPVIGDHAERAAVLAHLELVGHRPIHTHLTGQGHRAVGRRDIDDVELGAIIARGGGRVVGPHVFPHEEEMIAGLQSAEVRIGIRVLLGNNHRIAFHRLRRVAQVKARHLDLRAAIPIAFGIHAGGHIQRGAHEPAFQQIAIHEQRGRNLGLPGAHIAHHHSALLSGDRSRVPREIQGVLREQHHVIVVE